MYLGGDNSEKLSLHIMFSFFLVPFKILQKHVDRWTSRKTSKKTISKSVDCGQEAVFLFHVFCLSFKTMTKSVDRWTSNYNSEKKSFNHMYILIWKCGHLDKKVSFYFMFSFCYVPFTILRKKVWTGGPVMKIRKKPFNLLYLIALQHC